MSYMDGGPFRLIDACTGTEVVIPTDVFDAVVASVMDQRDQLDEDLSDPQVVECMVNPTTFREGMDRLNQFLTLILPLS